MLIYPLTSKQDGGVPPVDVSLHADGWRLDGVPVLMVSLLSDRVLFVTPSRICIVTMADYRLLRRGRRVGVS